MYMNTNAVSEHKRTLEFLVAGSFGIQYRQTLHELVVGDVSIRVRVEECEHAIDEHWALPGHGILEVTATNHAKNPIRSLGNNETQNTKKNHSSNDNTQEKQPGKVSQPNTPRTHKQPGTCCRPKLKHSIINRQ